MSLANVDGIAENPSTALAEILLKNFHAIDARLGGDVSAGFAAAERLDDFAVF